VRLIKLEQNYRSHGHILDAANALIRHNRARLGKELWTSEGKGEPVRAFAAPTDLDEAAFVVDVVKGLADEGVRCPRSRCSTAATRSRACSSTRCSAPGCPYRVWGGMRFFERAEVKHALAYLRLVAAARRTTARSCASSTSRRAASARARSSSCRTSRAAAARACGRPRRAARSAARRATSLATFIRTIEKLRAETASLPLPEAVEHVIEGAGLKAHYAAEKDGEDRVENLEELVNAAQGFVREADIASDAPMLSDRVAPDAPIPEDGPPKARAIR
jgi:DNA helicase-2/ATP-dependent DNA helicase PcrA